MRQSIVTRDGMRSVEVVSLKRRSPIKAESPKARKAERMMLSDLLDRLAHIHSRATKIGTVDDKDEVVRAIGSLEADLRRRGVV